MVSWRNLYWNPPGLLNEAFSGSLFKLCCCPMTLFWMSGWWHRVHQRGSVKSQFLKVTHLCESSVDFPFDLTVSDSQDSSLWSRTQNSVSTQQMTTGLGYQMETTGARMAAWGDRQSLLQWLIVQTVSAERMKLMSFWCQNHNYILSFRDV